MYKYSYRLTVFALKDCILFVSLQARALTGVLSQVLLSFSFLPLCLFHPVIASPYWPDSPDLSSSVCPLLRRVWRTLCSLGLLSVWPFCPALFYITVVWAIWPVLLSSAPLKLWFYSEFHLWLYLPPPWGMRMDGCFFAWNTWRRDTIWLLFPSVSPLSPCSSVFIRCHLFLFPDVCCCRSTRFANSSSWKNVLIDFAFHLFISFELTAFQMLDRNTDFNLWLNYRPTVM